MSLALAALWKILVVGLVLGAGLPVLFSVGIRALAYGAGGAAETADGGHAPPHPLGRVIGVACLAVVALCVLLGIAFIVASGFGKELSFSHVYPTIVSTT